MSGTFKTRDNLVNIISRAASTHSVYLLLYVYDVYILHELLVQSTGRVLDRKIMGDMIDSTSCRPNYSELKVSLSCSAIYNGLLKGGFFTS